MTHRADHQLDELAGALTDPFIVSPGGWGADTPAWLKQQATFERMVMLKTGPENTATDAEAAIYLMSASLEAPLDHDWTEIYLYVAHKSLMAHGTQVPDDLKVESITDYRQHKLNHLKSWIYAARVKHRVKTPREPQEVKQREAVVFRQSLFDLQEV